MRTLHARRPNRLRRVSVPLALAIVATTCAALAQETAAPATRSLSNVRDAARLFGSQATEKAQKALEQIERVTRVPTVVETIDSLDGEPIEEAAMGRARRLDGRGIYILI